MKILILMILGLSVSSYAKNSTDSTKIIKKKESSENVSFYGFF